MSSQEGSAPTGSPADPAARRRLIQERAKALGFDSMGICLPEPPPQVKLFNMWLDRGFQGRMEWMRRGAAKRLDPRGILPEVRSLILLTRRYGPQDPPSPPPLTGEISCYARGEDYHRILGEPSADLASFIESTWGTRSLEYVDTGPILERMWAAQAGVGWIGKNALVLNRDAGSYFFLAVILTELDLPADRPALDQCGACTLCIEACPTAAIVEPRVVDSRLCLSYHTIELRGTFPREHRSHAGSRVFGCDDCQSACPWNRDLIAVPAPFRPREENVSPDLVDLLQMDLPAYTRRFRGSAMKRATYHGLRRNAAIALGNVLAGEAGAGPGGAAERERAVAALERAAEDAEPSVADAASWALRRMDPARSDGGA